jgi:phage-related protein
VRPLGKGLNEIRAIGKEGIARVFFVARSEEIVILHGFVKKPDKTPKKEMDTARRRLKEVWDENA